MNTEKFEKSVTNLANSRVQKQIETFRNDIQNAFYKLTGDRYFRDSGKDSARGTNFKIARLMSENDITDIKSWPPYLWRKQEEKVREELFGMMDTVQRALIAPEPSDDGNKPQPETAE